MMDQKHKGAHSELTACRWLLERGYEVFRNISQHGIADLVAVRGDETLRIDVKTAPGGINGVRPGLRSGQAGIAALYVFPNGEVELELTPRINAPEAGECPDCGKTFIKFRANQKYCSDLCYGRAHRRHKCRECGKMFVAHGASRKWCSDTCADIDAARRHRHKQGLRRLFGGSAHSD